MYCVLYTINWMVHLCCVFIISAIYGKKYNEVMQWRQQHKISKPYFIIYFQRTYRLQHEDRKYQNNKNALKAIPFTNWNLKSIKMVYRKSRYEECDKFQSSTSLVAHDVAKNYLQKLYKNTRFQKVQKAC